ncbi:hypothetical protein CH254_02410 [Rhodococcus sp. 06-412-2C]|uniref:hypothetical protein n=1 Tax=unclassified Rhodococcus (in: high G+C Gram-positive bacteria) TaxID=192944 RepID=UPI000B9AAD58|nr:MULTISPECIES: hypothetical protein [unclassified Rhodococcus (in: high G+C Gram-positive bacteria)]OZC90347.1 hypothetical protein CH279_28590 [Rhodococcus sp. 06-412-2B]OZC90369.1 hypothetical protein CH279_28720 [Rhodococcus sp. 06-412-2B]OZC93070.1 hypothetical protein CH254_02410 [Rhodococcus sp. 06-412-2C]
MANPLEPDSVLARAATELRDAPQEPNWVDISASIITKVRNTTRRTWPIDSAFPSDSAAGPADSLRVSDHIVKTTLRRALADVHGAQPTEIDLDLDDHACIGLFVAVIGVYGDDLQAAGDELATIAIDTVSDLLGVTLGRDVVEIRVDDIEER